MQIEEAERLLQIEYDKAHQGWAEAHARGFPTDEAARAQTIRDFQKGGQWDLLRSLWEMEKPWYPGLYTFQFRLASGQFSEPFLVVVYRYGRNLKVRMGNAYMPPPFDGPTPLNCVLFNNCLWTRVQEREGE